MARGCGRGGAVLTLLWLAPLAAPAEPSSAADAQRLERGEVIVESRDIPGSEMPELTTTAIIDASIDRVWEIIDHCGDYQRTLMKVKSSRELSRTGTTVRCEIRVDTPWPLPELHVITVAEHLVSPDRRQRRWKLESGDYKENTGAWTLTPWAGGRTRVEYRVHSEPNLPVPASLQRTAMKEAMPKLIEKLRSDLK
jgi:ribosome-associated toxin RatA of RatAB toxin-antitoxin module